MLFHADDNIERKAIITVIIKGYYFFFVTPLYALPHVLVPFFFSPLLSSFSLTGSILCHLLLQYICEPYVL